MTSKELVTLFPRLYHLAEIGQWDSIRAYGLESTSTLLDRYGIAGKPREAIESCRRPAAVTLNHPQFASVVIRDQRPMSESVLAQCLIDMTPRGWYRLLNRQVFFWLTFKRLERLLKARLNRNRPHTLLVVDTAALLHTYRSQIRLSAINSGCTRPPLPRGRQTFRSLHAYPFAERCRQRRPTDAVVELTVPRKVSDITQFLLRVEEVRGLTVERTLWQRIPSDAYLSKLVSTRTRRSPALSDRSIL